MRLLVVVALLPVAGCAGASQFADKLNKCRPDNYRQPAWQVTVGAARACDSSHGSGVAVRLVTAGFADIRKDVTDSEGRFRPVCPMNGT